MGFCRRCGEITIGDRCKCGGTSKEPAIKPLFNSSSAGDKWGQRYLSKSAQTSPSSSPGNKSPVPGSGSSPFTSANTDRPPLRPTASSSSRPPSPSKLRSFIGEDDGELSSVFGSVLSPKDNWCCVACQSNFVQEEVIYPHPDAQTNPGLKEVYFCRPCFADRFAKGVCKKCKCAVLSDAPFIKHDDKLWHDSCYSCSYCPATEDIIIDFAGQPSCETCFDSAAYKTRGVPPSPHLAQGGFAPPAQLRPAPSKWGRDSVGKGRESLAGASLPKDMRREPQKDGEKEKASRLRMEREKSPMVPSFEELGEKLRRAGLEDPHPSTAMKTPVTDNIKLPSNPVSSPRETTRPLATSSPYQRSVKPLPIPPAFSNPPSTTSIPSTATPRPTHSRAWSMNPTSTPNPASATPLASPAITSATSRPSHTRARSLNSTPKTTTPIASQPYASTTTPPAWARPNPAVSSSSPWSKALQSEPQASQIEAPPPSSPTRPTPLLPTVPRRHLHVSLKPFDTKPIPSSLASPIKGLNSPKKGGPVAEEMCPACSKPLGYGEFIQLPKTGEVLHRGCFVCGGCGEQLDAGRHTEAEGKVWHSQCAPAPQRYRSIVTSLAEPPSPSSSSPTSPTSPTSPFSHTPLAVPVAETAVCSACSKDLGVGYSITIPRSGKSYHTDCFCCGGCGKGFGTVQGQRSFVEVNGEPFHSHCAPKPPPTASAPSAHARNPLRTSSSRASPLPAAPSPPKIAHPPPRESLTTGTTGPLQKSPSQPSIFATRPRPPSNLGGLLICSGCSVRATMSETVSGPRGRRYHARCLVCGGCKRGLDSEARVGEGGELRCEACRKTEARSSYRGNAVQTVA